MAPSELRSEFGGVNVNNCAFVGGADPDITPGLTLFESTLALFTA